MLIQSILIMRNLIFIIFCVLSVFLACSVDDNSSYKEEDSKVMKKDQINEIIFNHLLVSDDFEWSWVSDKVLIDALSYGDNVLAVGYGKEGEFFREQNSNYFQEIKGEVFSVATLNEGKSLDSILISDDDFFNVVELKVSNIETLRELKKLSNIRYLEPVGYSFSVPLRYHEEEEYSMRSSFGCDPNDSDYIFNDDYRVIPPLAQIAWNFDYHNIEEAWHHSTGSNVTVGLIDTGVSSNQKLLNSDFNDGWSNGRFIEKKNN